MTYNDTRVADIEWSADSILDFLKQNRDVLRSMGVNKIGLFGSMSLLAFCSPRANEP